MKYLAVVLSFYLLALAVMPCDEQGDCYSQETDHSALVDFGHSDHEEDTDNCSPFCICACCGHSVTVPDFSVSLPSLIPFPSKNLSVYAAVFISGGLFQIWHPPKIG